MEPVGLLTLPVELIHNISQYLSVQDVLSCSLTCHHLRTVLNDNSVWEKHLPQDVSRLATQKQLLCPEFSIDKGLSPLCESRQHFIRKTRLINNWKKGQYVKLRSKFTSNYFLRSLSSETKGKGHLIYNDKYIFVARFINDVESGGIEVWEISEVPVCYTVLKINYVSCNCFFIVGYYLVAVECFKVSVYRITLPEKDFPLVFSFLITDVNVTYEQRVEHIGMHNAGCVGWEHSTVNNYLISNKCGENVLHIWDVDNASKIGSFKPPIEIFSIELHSFTRKNLLFEFKMQASTNSCLEIFDMEKLQFTGPIFNYSFASHVVQYFPYIILFKNANNANPDGWYDTVGSIYDFNSSLKLRERRFDNASRNYLLNSITIVNGRFVILCNDGFHIVDALSLETVEKFEHDDAKFITKQIMLFDSLIVVTSNDSHKLELWDVNNNKKLPIDLKQVYTSHLYLDTLFTKLIIMNHNCVNVIHFW